MRGDICKWASPFVAMCMVFIGAGAFAQGTSPQPAAVGAAKPFVYDVTTVKPNNTGSGSIRMSTRDETFYGTNVTLKTMLENAFGIRSELISGLPGWAGSNHYDIVGKMSDADKESLKNITRDDRQGMLRQLLVERFQLKWHFEVKELPTFDLVVAKGGIKFPETAKDAPPDKQGSMNISNNVMTAYGVPMSSLSKTLEGQVERNIIDKTGLTGQYDLHLTWKRGDAPSNADEDAVPELFTALQEQLGLKLQPSKGPVNTLVVEHIELSAEN